MDAPTPRTEVHRFPDMAAYDSETINAILDEALFCHVGFIDDGSPVVIPTNYVRIDNVLYFHGSPESRLAQKMQEGIEVSVAITLLDGLVVARAPVAQSLNYRSVIVFGTTRSIENHEEKFSILRTLTEHVTPGRWDDSRATTDQEVHETLVLALPIDEASAKISAGPPWDDEEDLKLPYWAGVVPISLVAGEPVPAEGVDWPAPDYLNNYRRPT